MDTVCTSQDIFYAFDKAGFDIDEITSIQRRNSNRSWVVSFRSFEHKEAALELNSIIVCGLEVFLGDAQFRTVFVKIYECPTEMPDTVVIGRLSRFGQVLSFRRDRIGDVIYNGVRMARMRLRHHIPCSLHIVGEPIFVYYDSQLRSCRRCGDVDHIAQNCRASRCFNCDKAGHRNDDCSERPMCRACFSEDHEVRDCPFILYSGNVKPPAPGETTKSYAAAAVLSGPRPPVPDQEQMRAQERRAQERRAQAESAKNKAEDAVKENSSHRRQEERRHDDRQRRDDDRRRRRADHHTSDCPYVILSANVEHIVAAPSPSYADIARQNGPARLAAPQPAEQQQQRKRKADRGRSRSTTPDRTREVNPAETGKVRGKEKEPSREREPSRDRDEPSRDRDEPRHREDRYHDHEDRYHHEERREDRRRERDRGREGERERRREGHRPRERSERDRGGNHDRRRSPDRRTSRDHSPPLYSSESESDDGHRDRRRHGRRSH